MVISKREKRLATILLRSRPRPSIRELRSAAIVLVLAMALLAATLLLAGLGPARASPVELRTGWTMCPAAVDPAVASTAQFARSQNAAAASCIAAVVPGTVLTSLLANGSYFPFADPYYDDRCNLAVPGAADLLPLLSVSFVGSRSARGHGYHKLADFSLALLSPGSLPLSVFATQVFITQRRVDVQQIERVICKPSGWNQSQTSTQPGQRTTPASSGGRCAAALRSTAFPRPPHHHHHALSI